jgi:hypothetical protein
MASASRVAALIGALAGLACVTPSAAAVTIAWGGDVTLGSSYSLGNLRGWRNFSTAGTLSYSAVLTVELSPRGRLTGGRVTSLRLNGIGVPRLDRTNGAARLMRRLGRSDFGDRGVWFTRRGRPGQA